MDLTEIEALSCCGWKAFEQLAIFQAPNVVYISACRQLSFIITGPAGGLGAWWASATRRARLSGLGNGMCHGSLAAVYASEIVVSQLARSYRVELSPDHLQSMSSTAHGAVLVLPLGAGLYEPQNSSSSSNGLPNSSLGVAEHPEWHHDLPASSTATQV
jgi:hypothetical protein